MLDPAVIEECMHCLAGAAVHGDSEDDLSLATTALARDLADTHGSRARALLDAAWRKAVSYLDSSDLGTESFVAALRRLAKIRARVDAILLAAPAI